MHTCAVCLVWVSVLCRMVRKRKSYARDSKGFEPIEEYFKEMKEALTQNSSGEMS